MIGKSSFTGITKLNYFTKIIKHYYHLFQTSFIPKVWSVSYISLWRRWKCGMGFIWNRQIRTSQTGRLILIYLLWCYVGCNQWIHRQHFAYDANRCIQRQQFTCQTLFCRHFCPCRLEWTYSYQYLVITCVNVTLFINYNFYL